LQLSSASRDHQAAESRARAAEADVAAARAAQVEAAPAGGGASAVAVVRSASAGSVLRVLEPSERVLPAGSPLLIVGDPAGLEVIVDVLSTDAVRIQPGARVRLVEWGGEGALEARVRLVEPGGFTKVSALGVEEQRVMVVADLLRAADVFALPAVGEGYGIAVVEALSCGAPVVVTDAGAMRELAADAGLLVAPGDREGFCRALASVVSDHDLRHGLAERAKDRSFPAPTELVERVGKIYDEVCR
jgi:HlyD family secretion protein